MSDLERLQEALEILRRQAPEGVDAEWLRAQGALEALMEEIDEQSVELG